MVVDKVIKSALIKACKRNRSAINLPNSTLHVICQKQTPFEVKQRTADKILEAIKPHLPKDYNSPELQPSNHELTVNLIKHCNTVIGEAKECMDRIVDCCTKTEIAFYTMKLMKHSMEFHEVVMKLKNKD